MMVWSLRFHDGPLEGRKKILAAPGNHPPHRVWLNAGDKLEVRLGPDASRDLTDDDRLYHLVHQDGHVVTYKWFDGFVCDFCYGQPVQWDYPGRDFRTAVGDAVFESLDKGWAVCDECHAIVESDDREALIERAFLGFERVGVAPRSRSERKRLEGEVRLIQDGFWRNRKGDPIPFTGKREDQG